MYVKLILSVKKKPPPELVKACRPLIIALSRSEWENFLLPHVTKYLLRNAEIILESIEILLSQLRIDLSQDVEAFKPVAGKFAKFGPT